jgi:hypothetical protein
VAKDKKIVVGALNITMQPHSPTKYVELIRAASRLKKPAKIFGDQFGLLVGARKLDTASDASPICGDLYTSTNQFASLDELEDVKLPEYLKPNSSKFSYVFYPQNHILIYEGYYDGNTLSPSNVVRFFENMFNAQTIKRRFGKIDVTHEPETDALDKALRMKHKDKISMIIKRPNPDDLAGAEREVLKRLRAINAEKQEISYKAANADGLELDQEIETLARVAARNGDVYVKGRDIENRPQEFSTKEHPLLETEYYDPGSELPFSVFNAIAERVKNEIIKRLVPRK